MQNCVEKIATHIVPIASYSGRYFMMMGNYNDCIRAEGMDYNQVFFNGVGNTIAMLYTGLCLPVQCTPEIIKEAIDEISKSLGQDLRVASINNKINHHVEPYTWVFFTTIALISILLTLLLLATFHPKCKDHKMLNSFSLHNSLKIFKYQQSSRLNILNGVKSLAMLSVIFGHMYSLIIINTSNILSISSILETWEQLIIESAILAVDTFFFVGGFLVAYSILKQDKVKSTIRYPLAVVNPYLRFLPSYLMAILLYYAVMPHLVSGPFSYQNATALKNCETIWKPLLFVDNLVDNGNSQCMGWGWYLQNDMQIFVFSVLILFIYSKSRFWSLMAIFVTIAGSFAYTMEMTFDNSYKYTTHLTDFDNYGDYMSYLYVKPWSRCPPYMFGLFLGILYIEFLVSEKKHNSKPPNPNQIDFDQNSENSLPKTDAKHFFLILKQFFVASPWGRRLIEITGLIICLFVVFIPRTAQGDDRHWTQLAHSLFLTYSKLFFIVGLALILLPSLLGVNDLVRHVLDTKAFNFIGKISFWTYLVHLTIMYGWITSMKINFYYAYVPLFTLAIAITVQSMVIGFLFCLLVEIPFIGLQKKLMGALVKYFTERSRRSRPKQTEELEQPGIQTKSITGEN